MTGFDMSMKATQTTLRSLRKALVIGRSAADGMMLRVLMFQEGFTIEIIEGANEALERLRTVRFDAAMDRRGLQDNQSLRREMDVARNIQRDFIPESLPVVRGVKLWGALHAARQVSGDFYDAFPLPSGSLLLVVGDVCDKGVGAALFMALDQVRMVSASSPL